MLLDQTCAIVDLETTGANNAQNAITEIASLVITEHGDRTDYEQLINPGRPIPAHITQLTGITQAMVADAPYFESVAEPLYQQWQNCIFIAHNVRFDYGFLRRQFEVCGLRFQPKMLCTVRLARALYPEWSSHRLDHICQEIGYVRDVRHRAMADVLATKAFLDYAITDKGIDCVNEQAQRQLKRPTLPRQLAPELIDTLPDTFGVYRFYNGDGQLLYVGKSNQIRTRILSHFSNDVHQERTMKMMQSIADIDYTVTAGELSALLLENHEIKTRSPLYNRRQRKLKKLWFFQLHQPDGEYPRLTLQCDMTDTWQTDQPVYGLFRSKKDANRWKDELFKTHGFCLKINGDEKGRSGAPCFARQLKRCGGACEHAITPEHYRLALASALTEKLISPWPYDGPQVHVEYNPEYDLAQGIVAHHWAWLDTRTLSDNPFMDVSDYTQTPTCFDVDVYHILRRYFKPVSRPVT